MNQIFKLMKEEMKKCDTGPVVKLRKVIKCGRSFYISIPQPFIKLHGIQKGEKLPVLANHIMKVVPMKEE